MWGKERMEGMEGMKGMGMLIRLILHEDVNKIDSITEYRAIGYYIQGYSNKLQDFTKSKKLYYILFRFLPYQIFETIKDELLKNI